MGKSISVTCDQCGAEIADTGLAVTVSYDGVHFLCDIGCLVDWAVAEKAAEEAA